VLKGTRRGKRGLKGALEEKSKCLKALEEESEVRLEGVLEKGGRVKKRNTLDGQGLEGALERR
jgi:hypothetical protein